MDIGSFYIQQEFDGDYVEISKLFSSENNPQNSTSNPSYLEWLYDANPHGKAIISCAREEGTNKLVGVYIVNPVELWLAGVRRMGALSLNTFTHKDYRGKGMFTILAKTCYELSKRKGIYCIIGFPNKMSYGGFVKKLGFKDLGTIPYLVKPLNYFNLAKNFLFKYKSDAKLSSIQIKSTDQILELDVNSLSRLEVFLNKHREKNLFQSYRTAAHYRWRFFENTLNKYRVFVDKNITDEISTVLVLKTISGVTNDIQLVDFCCIDQQSGKEMIEFVFKESKSEFSFARVFAQKSTLEHKVLISLGFVNKDKYLRGKIFLPFIFKPLQPNDMIIPFDKWHLSMADSDVV